MDLKRMELVKLQVEILKLKADDYNWQCHVPEHVKVQLDKTLEEINSELNKDKGE